MSAENDGYESLLEGERVKKVENFGAYNTYFGPGDDLTTH